MPSASPTGTATGPIETTAARIRAVRASLAEAVTAAGRAIDDVTLMAVSKTRSAEEVRAAIDQGLRHFGENYLQEALAKIDAIGDGDVVWHFIGAIQSNKTRELARRFQWVHCVDREKIADRLSQARAATEAPPLNVCLQVNVDAEPQKAGIAPEKLAALVAHTASLPAIALRGLMAIPAPSDDTAATRAAFVRMRELFETHRSIGGANWDTLSMGMSGDYPLAVQEGATIVRIGTALFGPRVKPNATNDTEPAA